MYRQTDRQSMTGRSDMHIHSPNAAPVVPGISVTSLREQDSTEMIWSIIQSYDDNIV